MRTLHKIYLFVILICIILYNLYNVSKKNKEGFSLVIVQYLIGTDL